MNVLIVAPVFTPARGGGERFLRDLADALHGAGNRVTVLTPQPGSEDTAYPVMREPPLVRGGGIAVLWPGTLFRAVRVAAAQVIITSGPDINEWPARLVAAICGVPVVSVYVADLNKKKALSRHFMRVHLVLLRTFDAVVTIAEPYRTLLRKRGISARAMRCIEPGVPHQVPSTDRVAMPRKGLLFVGALDEAHTYKRLDILVDALAGIDERERPHLTIVGDGSARARYEAVVRARRLGEAVSFEGRVDDDALHALYASSVAVVLPSPDEREGFGLVLLEAAATGCALIATTGIGSASSLRRCGVELVAPGDSAAMAAAIVRLSEDDAFRRAQSGAARRWSEDHDWSHAIRRWRRCLERVRRRAEIRKARRARAVRRCGPPIAALLFVLVCLWRMIAAHGTILYSFEWYVPPYPAELRRSLVETLGPWTQQNFGIANVFPSMAWIVAFEALFAPLGGGFVDKLLLTITIGGAFYGTFLLLRRLRYSPSLSLVGAAIYGGSPFLFNHAAAGHVPYLGAIGAAPFVYAGLIQAQRGHLRRSLAWLLLMPLIAQLQAFVSLCALLVAHAAVFRSRRAALYAAAAIGVWSLSNAFWLVPLAFSLRRRLETLNGYFPTNLGLDLASGSRPLLLALRLEPYNNPISLGVEQHAGVIGGVATGLAYIVPLAAIVGLVAAVLGPRVRRRSLTIFLGVAWLVSLALFVGTDSPWGSIVVFLYRRLTVLSLYKELYHFGFAIALVLPVLFAQGGETIRRVCSRSARFRKAAEVLVVAGAVGWTFPFWFTGNIGGWAQPVVPTADDRRAAQLPTDGLHRMLVLPNAGNMRWPGRESARGPIDGIDHLLTYGAKPSFGSWLPMYPLAVALDDALDRGDVILARALLPYSNVNVAYLRSAPTSMFARDNIGSEAATLAAVLRERKLSRVAFHVIPHTLPIVYGTRARFRCPDALLCLQRLALLGVVPAAVTDQPQLGARAPVFLDGSASLDARYMACQTCETLEPGTLVNLSYDPTTGWVSGNISSNWIAYYDEYPGPLSTAFLYTVSSAPLTLPLPMPFAAAKRLALRVKLLGGPSPKAKGAWLRVQYDDGPWSETSRTGMQWIVVRAGTLTGERSLRFSGYGARVVDRIVRGMDRAPRGASPVSSPAGLRSRGDSAVRLRVRRVSEARYDVRIPQNAGPFTLVLSQSFESGWHLEGESGKKLAAPHILVNGGVNGWDLPAAFPRRFSIVYGNARVRRAARLVSAGGLAIFCLALLTIALRERTERRKAKTRA